MSRNVLVTGIGGVVGQGILRNINNQKLDIRIIGVNVQKVSAGNYLCDNVYEVPYSFDPGYITSMQEICKNEDIELIIPSTDYEAYYLALTRDAFNCPIAASPAATTKFCLDKYENFKTFNAVGIPFAQSFLPSEYDNRFETCIVKPREGRGSRNINVNPDKPTEFDDSYVVQQLLEGPEITTTFYVKQNGQLHGHITFQRELELGNTAKAEVVTIYDTALEEIIHPMLRNFDFRGSCNIQSKVTNEGIIPFEINCRISGTNSVRSQFGFKDVWYTLQELLLMQEPDQPRVVPGTALRVILDLIYPGRSLNEISNRQDQFYIY